MEEVTKDIDEAINYIDKLELVISRLKPGDTLSAGVVYQMYELLMLTREKLVETRFKILKMQSK